MPPNLNYLLNTPVSAFPHRILVSTTNSESRILYALIKINRTKYHLTRRYNPNGSCYFHIETP